MCWLRFEGGGSLAVEFSRGRVAILRAFPGWVKH